jgi:hypothetical protein
MIRGALASRYGISPLGRGVIRASETVITKFFNQLYSGARNNFTGCLGFRFKPTRNITIVALGRSVSTSIAANHAVKIWTETPAEICTVTITPSSLVDALGYAYETLATPITLVSGTYYRIASDETSGGDKWMDLGTVSNHLNSADIYGSVFQGTKSAYPFQYGAATDKGYVVPTFYE